MNQLRLSFTQWWMFQGAQGWVIVHRSRDRLWEVKWLRQESINKTFRTVPQIPLSLKTAVFGG